MKKLALLAAAVIFTASVFANPRQEKVVAKPAAQEKTTAPAPAKEKAAAPAKEKKAKKEHKAKASKESKPKTEKK